MKPQTFRIFVISLGRTGRVTLWVWHRESLIWVEDRYARLRKITQRVIDRIPILIIGRRAVCVSIVLTRHCRHRRKQEPSRGIHSWHTVSSVVRCHFSMGRRWPTMPSVIKASHGDCSWLILSSIESLDGSLRYISGRQSPSPPLLRALGDCGAAASCGRQLR